MIFSDNSKKNNKKKDIFQKKLIFRKYKRGDEKQIIELFKSTFIEQPSGYIEYWNWIYRDNTLKKNMSYVVECDEKIIGHFGLVPVSMNINNKLFTGILALNVVIHKDYRGQGIFFEFKRYIDVNIRKQNISFIYIYPNNRIYPIYIKKLGWINIPLLPPLVKPLNLKSLFNRKIKCKFLVIIMYPFGYLFQKIFLRNCKNISDKIDIKKISFFNAKINDFFKNISKEFKLITVRNKKFLTWRYINNPCRDYAIFFAQNKENILGYIITTISPFDKDSKTGIIVDLLTLPKMKKVANNLILKAISNLEEMGVDVVICHIQNKYYYKLIRKMGFIPFLFQKNKTKLCIRLLNTEKKPLFSLKNWFLSDGDRFNEI